MINPRTIPYTPQRLVAIKKEFTRPLPQAPDSLFPFGASTLEVLKQTPQPNLESRCLRLAKNGMLVSNGTTAAKLPSLTEYNSLNQQESQKVSNRYVPYIIGGAIITLLIYLYFQSRTTKEKEETN